MGTALVMLEESRDRLAEITQELLMHETIDVEHAYRAVRLAGKW